MLTQLVSGAILGIGSTISMILPALLVVLIVFLIFKIASKIIKTILFVLLAIAIIWFALGLLSGLGVMASLAQIPVIGSLFS